MDALEFVACIGKTDDAPEVTQLLASVGVVKKMKAPRDGGDIDVPLKKLGVFLVFRPMDPKSSKLTLFGVQFYSQETGFQAFKGVLPSGLVFGDAPADVKKKLGKPARAIKFLRRETWKLGNQELMVEYGKKDDCLSVVFQNLPTR